MAKPTEKVRVTRRVESEPDHRGRRRLLAREGRILTRDRADARGIPPDATEPYRPQRPTQDEPAGGSEGSEDSTGDHPQHRGGGVWLLSDGSTFRGPREAAEQAEAALDPSDGDPEEGGSEEGGSEEGDAGGSEGSEDSTGDEG